MRNQRVVRRADDMPLYATMKRMRKNLYEIIIKAKASKRIVDIEQLPLPNRKAVKAFFARTYPTLTWGEPKYRKPRLKIVRTNPKSKKGKRHAIPRAVRLRNQHRTLL